MSNTNGGGGGFYEAYKQALARKSRAERGDDGNDAKNKPGDTATSAQMTFIVEVCVCVCCSELGKISR
jgi:hypothetical protein